MIQDAFERWTTRLDPILDQLERLLAGWVGTPASPALFERSQAFRWRVGRGVGRLEPIEQVSSFDLEDLIGVEAAVEALDRNVRQLLGGLPYNDVLLHGERGTGKSSAVRGLLTRYADQGLRIIEVDRGDLADLPQLLATLRRGTRGVSDRHAFLIFCDDLSFGASELGFRELKAALEGGIEARPGRVCVVATSNRRHLLPETMAENRAARVDAQGELHLGEALEEKLALADRFGLVLGFYGCNQATYLEIVRHWLSASGIDELSEDAREAALRYSLERGGRSGRIARQFANEWIGRARLGELPESRSLSPG
jgi:predicted AAA+ superfamily ATPase